LWVFRTFAGLAAGRGVARGGLPEAGRGLGWGGFPGPGRGLTWGPFAAGGTEALAGFSAGRFFPGERWWPQLFRAGVPVLVNSDAHDPARTDAHRTDALNLIESMP
jgi:hypothetical protein